MSTATVLRADAGHLPLPDASVDLVVTSPPYFALRSYTDGGEHYAGQIGAEPTPQEYIAALIACTREWMRVLKPSGSLFVNLGDKYATNGAPKAQSFDDRAVVLVQPTAGRISRSVLGVPQKSLMMLPERYRIAAVDELGLIARAVIVWSKPNGLPESVTDRVRRSHEDWVHLTKAPRYFSAVDEIREQYAPGMTERAARYAGRDIAPNTWAADSGRGDSNPSRGNLGFAHRGLQPLGKLPGSVWEVATEPLKVPDHLGVDHFAAFPTEWPRRIILGWSPSGICVECGEGRRPVAERDPVNPAIIARRAQRGSRDADYRGVSESSLMRVNLTSGESPATRITGEVCACPDTSAPTRPAVVLDPFGGTGTTALVASVLGRHGISVDMSADYCRLARWRTTDPGQRAKAMRVAAPVKQLDGQADLFGEWVS